MVRTTHVVAAIAALTLGGAAQAQTSTDCIRTAMGMQCNTSPSGDAQFATGMTALANALAAKRQAKAVAPRYLEALRTGDCETALSLAAGYGNADDVRVANTCFEGRAAGEKTRKALEVGDCQTAIDLTRRYGRPEDVKDVQACVPASEVAAATATAKENERIWMTTITAAVADGRCDEAKANALAGGRLDVADQVVRVCTPKPTP